MSLENFRDRVLRVLLPEFCNDPARNYDIAGFKPNFEKVHALDAEGFLKALDSKLVRLEGRLYWAPQSRAGEQFFWDGTRNKVPRTIAIWVEPVITVAAIARLHFDFGWPQELLGLQSAKWEFDAAAYLPGDLKNEYIACEVKKTAGELRTLIELMHRYGACAPCSVEGAKEVNAYNKIRGLRARRASIFWAAGPGGIGSVFQVSYSADDLVTLSEVSISALHYPSSSLNHSPALR